MGAIIRFHLYYQQEERNLGVSVRNRTSEDSTMNDERKRRLSYADAGVNIDASDEAMRNIAGIIHRTFDNNVLDRKSVV